MGERLTKMFMGKTLGAVCNKLKSILGLRTSGSWDSSYKTFETLSGELVTIRIGDHQAKEENFINKANTKYNVSLIMGEKADSIVIKSKGTSKVYSEVLYRSRCFTDRNREETMTEILKGLQEALRTGIYKKGRMGETVVDRVEGLEEGEDIASLLATYGLTEDVVKLGDYTENYTINAPVFIGEDMICAYNFHVAVALERSIPKELRERDVLPKTLKEDNSGDGARRNVCKGIKWLDSYTDEDEVSIDLKRLKIAVRVAKEMSIYRKREHDYGPLFAIRTREMEDRFMPYKAAVGMLKAAKLFGTNKVSWIKDHTTLRMKGKSGRAYFFTAPEENYKNYIDLQNMTMRDSYNDEVRTLSKVREWAKKTIVGSKVTKDVINRMVVALDELLSDTTESEGSEREKRKRLIRVKAKAAMVRMRIGA